MAVTVMKAAILPRCYYFSHYFPSQTSIMNTFTLLAVFTLGVVFTCLVSILTVYIQKDIKWFEVEQKREDLIAIRQQILEKSHKFILIPDESQLSVVDTELALDPSLLNSGAGVHVREEEQGIHLFNNY